MLRRDTWELDKTNVEKTNEKCINKLVTQMIKVLKKIAIFDMWTVPVQNYSFQERLKFNFTFYVNISFSKFPFSIIATLSKKLTKSWIRLKANEKLEQTKIPLGTVLAYIKSIADIQPKSLLSLNRKICKSHVFRLRQQNFFFRWMLLSFLAFGHDGSVPPTTISIAQIENERNEKGRKYNFSLRQIPLDAKCH